MSNGKSLAILALIIGIRGLGFGIYSVFFPQIQVKEASKFDIQKTWFKYDPTLHPTDPTLTNITIGTLTINFTVNSGESVYFLFNTNANLIVVPTVTILINFMLDGLILDGAEHPQAAIFSNNQDFVVSGTLQMATDTIPPDSHNITINILGNHLNNI